MTSNTPKGIGSSDYQNQEKVMNATSLNIKMADQLQS